MDINRVMLASQLADKNGYTKKEALRIVDSVTELILKNIQNGCPVSIHGFGCFDLVERKARLCPNKQLGTMFEVPAHYVPRFFPGAKMHRAVRDWEAGEKKVGE